MFLMIHNDGNVEKSLEVNEAMCDLVREEEAKLFDISNPNKILEYTNIDENQAVWLEVGFLSPREFQPNDNLVEKHPH